MQIYLLIVKSGSTRCILELGRHQTMSKEDKKLTEKPKLVTNTYQSQHFASFHA
jgi:hypothetical protein